MAGCLERREFSETGKTPDSEWEEWFLKHKQPSMYLPTKGQLFMYKDNKKSLKYKEYTHAYTQRQNLMIQEII